MQQSFLQQNIWQLMQLFWNFPELATWFHNIWCKSKVTHHGSSNSTPPATYESHPSRNLQDPTHTKQRQSSLLQFPATIFITYSNDNHSSKSNPANSCPKPPKTSPFTQPHYREPIIADQTRNQMGETSCQLKQKTRRPFSCDLNEDLRSQNTINPTTKSSQNITIPTPWWISITE